MDIHQALLTRRTIHDYEPGAVEEEALTRALSAAIRAPNHKLTNPWRFTRSGPRVRGRLVELLVELKLAAKGPSPQLEEKLRKKFGNPAELFIVSQVLDTDDFRRREDYAATACAIENFCLSLWGDGLGSKWSTGAVTRHEETYRLLEIDQKVEEIVGFVWVGYPAEVPDTPRRPLSEVVRTTE